MGSIIGLLAGKTIFGKVISDRMARIIAMAGLFLVILAVLGTAKCAYDRNLIRNHDAKQTAATAVADRKADTKAADQRRVDDARITQETAQLEKVQANAPTDTARRLARHRCLRAQQSARASGKPSPIC